MNFSTQPTQMLKESEASPTWQMFSGHGYMPSLSIGRHVNSPGSTGGQGDPKALLRQKNPWPYLAGISFSGLYTPPGIPRQRGAQADFQAYGLADNQQVMIIQGLQKQASGR